MVEELVVVELVVVVLVVEMVVEEVLEVDDVDEVVDVEVDEEDELLLVVVNITFFGVVDELLFDVTNLTKKEMHFLRIKMVRSQI